MYNFVKVPSKTDSSITVKEIKLTFNKNKPEKFILFKNYTFNTGNNFALEISHIYDEYGIITALVNCSNSISSQLIEQEIRVGRVINGIEGFVINPYANVNTPVTLFVKIFAGNGYTVNWNLDNDLNVSISWSQIKNKINNNYIHFTENGGIKLTAKYVNHGRYFTKVEVVNSFGKKVYTPCSPVTILSTRTNSLQEKKIQSNESCSFQENTILVVNSKVCLFFIF